MVWVLLVLLTATAFGQDTRGMIFGRVLDPSSAPVAGARVILTQTETNVSTALVTNDTGYYQGSLLIAGTYRLTAEASGFKTWVRDGVTLPVSTELQVEIRLEMGQMSETVSVTAEAPLLETSTMSSGRVVETRSILDLPVPGGNVMLLSKLTAGLQTTDSLSDKTFRLHSRDAASRFTEAGGVGGNEWSVDGAPNAGISRRVAYMPVPEVVQEFKVETSGFDASIGHSTGANVAIMTKAGTNNFHGALRETHHQWRWDGLEFFTKQAYYRRIASAATAGNTTLARQLRETSAQPPGRENQYAGTLGGPVLLPKVFNGKDKLFFFFGYTGFRMGEYRFTQNTVPTLANRQGDFSQLLNVDAVRYQVYDPLSVQPDSGRATHFIRTPFPGNRIPLSRVTQPATYNLFTKNLPQPNNDPGDPALEPVRNFSSFSSPYFEHYYAYSNRFDYRLSDRHRFLVSWTKSKWDNGSPGWLYQSPFEDISGGSVRANFGMTADWVYTVNPTTILNVAVAGNNYRQQSMPGGGIKYKPSDLGLPAYLDLKAGDQHVLPSFSWSGYTGVSPGGRAVARWRVLSGKADLSHVRANHTFRAGLDVRGQYYTEGDPGSNSGTFGFSNSYTRRNDDTFTPAGDLGLSWAAFLLGMPNSLAVDTNDSLALLNPYYAGYVQEHWRVTPRLTLNFGLRLEYEMGATERYNRFIGYFDPAAKLPITDAAQAAYAAKPVPELAASQFVVQGGSVYPGSGGADRRLWKNALMWLPRAAAAYQINSKTVLRGGYGLFFDTLNVLNEGDGVDQSGFSRRTSSIMTTDFGMNWLLGNPKAGVSPLADPFPVRADGTRFDAPLKNALGLMAKVGRGWSSNPFDRQHARQQRWRASLQRQFHSTMVIDVAYAGSYSDRVQVTKTISALPAQYWADGLARNDAVANNMNANVTNPFAIGNFAALKSSNPVLYTDMSTNGFFTSSTIRKNQLLRPNPQMNGLSQRWSPGKVKTHELNVSFERRFSRGFNLNLAYTMVKNHAADFFWNEFDANPSWRPSNNSRPHRLTGNAIYEFPFGRGRRFLKKGPLSYLVGGFQISATYELQPGALIDWGNMFYYGKLEDINTGSRTLGRWFNTAGFERTSTKAPASFHRRVFPTRIEGLRADMMNNWNGSAQREFKLRESVALRFRLDLMNLQNRSMFAAPNTNPISTDFGKVTATSSRGSSNRWIQIQARLQF